jgi:hypothetical protein
MILAALSAAEPLSERFALKGASVNQTAVKAAESTQLGGVLSMMGSRMLGSRDYGIGHAGNPLGSRSIGLKKRGEVVLPKPGVVFTQLDQRLNKAGLKHEVTRQRRRAAARGRAGLKCPQSLEGVAGGWR